MTATYAVLGPSMTLFGHQSLTIGQSFGITLQVPDTAMSSTVADEENATAPIAASAPSGELPPQPVREEDPAPFGSQKHLFRAAQIERAHIADARMPAPTQAASIKAMSVSIASQSDSVNLPRKAGGGIRLGEQAANSGVIPVPALRHRRWPPLYSSIYASRAYCQRACTFRA